MTKQIERDVILLLAFACKWSQKLGREEKDSLFAERECQRVERVN